MSSIMAWMPGFFSERHGSQKTSQTGKNEYPLRRGSRQTRQPRQAQKQTRASAGSCNA